MVWKKQDTPYEKFTVDDFLQDEYFIFTMKNPSEESELFWQNIHEKHGFDSVNFNNARKLIQAIHANYPDPFSQEDISDVWNRIEDQQISKPKKSYKLWYSVVAVAAAIALLVMFMFPENKEEIQIDQILSFAESNKQSFENDSVIRLILSENKELISLEKESFITYNTSNITVADTDIDKSEAATFNQLYVPNGKRSQITLSDGTHIWVNAGTSLTYPVEFDQEKREIYVNGEIYLDVTPDPERPFIVRTHDIDITVLGTSFNVTAYEVETVKRVILASGSVKITNPDKKEYNLQPSDKYETDNGNESIVQVDPWKYTAWTQGIYYYESAEFSEVVKYLSRYYGKTVECSDQAAFLKCTGKLDILDDLGTLLEHLTLVLPICVKHENGKYLITKK